MKKPVIAVTGQLDPKLGLPIEIAIYGATSHNCDHLVEHGAIPVVIPFIDPADIEQVIAGVDGLLMTGGADVDPSRYNEEKQPYCASIQPDRDAADLALFAEALKQGKPIMCICRGCQIANVFFGGSLYQDINTQVGPMINHSDYGVNWNTEGSHTIAITPESPLHKLLGKTELGVNSLHHQGVKDLGKGVIPMGVALDGVVESWYYDSDTQWIRAYQWHPEMQKPNDAAKKIFDDFVAACKK